MDHVELGTACAEGLYEVIKKLQLYYDTRNLNPIHQYHINYGSWFESYDCIKRSNLVSVNSPLNLSLVSITN